MPKWHGTCQVKYNVLWCKENTDSNTTALICHDSMHISLSLHIPRNVWFVTSTLPIITFTDDPPPYKDGVRINSPHYLCKLVEESTKDPYTLVISQYEKNNTTHYTLRVYSTCEFSLTRFPNLYKKQLDQRVRTVLFVNRDNKSKNDLMSFSSITLLWIHWSLNI